MTRLLLVVSRGGAVLPRDLAAGLSGWAEVLVVRTPDSRATWSPLLDDLGSVLDVPAHGPLPWDSLRRFDPDGVLTFCEDALERSAEIAEGLGRPHVSPTAVRRVRDKVAQRRRLLDAGVDATSTAVVTTAADLAVAARVVGFPMVLKPRRGSGSAHTTLARTLEEAQAHVSGVGDATSRHPMVAEQYLVGRTDLPFADYVSVESVVGPRGVVHLGVTGKLPLLPPFRETGQFHPSGLDDALAAACGALTTAAVEALDIDAGAVHTEIKLTPEGPRIIEVNARPGGYLTELYSRVLGTDVVTLVARLASGEDVRVPEPVSGPEGPVHFQFTHQPPPGARRLTALRGARDVARHPAVVRYERLTRAGASLPDDLRTHDLDLICGTATSHAVLQATLTDVRRHLTFEFDTTTGPVSSSGDTLHAAP